MDPSGYIVESAQPIDPEVAKRALRKIDLFLMPAMVIGECAALLPGHHCKVLIDPWSQAMVSSTTTKPFSAALPSLA